MDCAGEMKARKARIHFLTGSPRRRCRLAMTGEWLIGLAMTIKGRVKRDSSDRISMDCPNSCHEIHINAYLSSSMTFLANIVDNVPFLPLAVFVNGIDSSGFYADFLRDLSFV